MRRSRERHGPDIQRGDAILFTLCVLANLCGLALIFSATRYTESLQDSVWKQAIAMLLGICAYALVQLVDIELVLERHATLLFVCNILLLLLLIPFGNDDGSGNKSWIRLPGSPFNLQPAELVKLSFVLLLAVQFYRLKGRGVSRPRAILQTGGHTLFLCALIFFVSGDMGMVLVYGLIFVCMAWMAGVRLLWFAGAGLGVLGMGWLAWPHLPSYIQMRVLVVLQHDLDPLGKGFQQMRSLLAIGSGQVTGQGYLQGVQTQSTVASALPARHTDFIFAVAGEEFGLLGCLVILVLLTALVFRCFFIAATAPSSLYTYIAVGYGGMLAVQSLLNIGMCLFVAPVVGLTLPFFSYGGSSIVTLYLAMGIVSGIKRRAQPSRLQEEERGGEGKNKS